MKKILLTGGSGFVGSSLLKRLQNKFNIYSIDARENHFFNKDKQFKLDLSKIKVYDLLKRENFEICIHTAGVFKNNNEIIETTKMDTNIINFCNQQNVKIIYISTFLINVAPESDYAKLKLDTEKKIKATKLPHIIIRPESIYSLDEKKIKFYKKFKVFNSTISFPRKNVFRSPSHIDDLCKFIEIIIKNNKFTNKIYEFGGPKISYENMLIQCNNNNLKVYNIPVFIKFFFKILLNIKFGKSIIESQELDRITNTNELKIDFDFQPREFSLNE
jgi:nucleoside-diphosphate-sugar epimerase